MGTRTASADWRGGLVNGTGTISLVSSGRASFDYSLATRAADAATTTSPEELLAAAYASCYAMQLSALLDPGPQENPVLHVAAIVTQGGPEVDFGITDIVLTVQCSGIDRTAEQFAELAHTASSICPIGRALAGGAIKVTVAAGLG